MNERNLKVEGDVFYMAGMNDGMQPNMFGTGTKTKRSACQSWMETGHGEKGMNSQKPS